MDVVKHELSAATAQSKVDRSIEEREVLRTSGGAVHVFELQGFLFFGTANRLLERARSRVEDPEQAPLRYLLIDFRRVIGLDSSAVLSFSKAVQMGAQKGFTLVFTGFPDGVRNQLERGGITPTDTVRFFPQLDRGLEWCEDRLLDGAGATGVVDAALLERLARVFVDVGVDELGDYLERFEVAAGEEIIRQGDPAGDVFFLESGQLTAQLHTGGGVPLRLRTMGPGTVVGEMAMYLGGERTASVVAERPSVLYRLPQDAIDRMEEQHPELAAAMHRFFARMLADRLSETLRSMSALRD
jgi:SulP family sulfate permease